jgi:hypothetical protein
MQEVELDFAGSSGVLSPVLVVLGGRISQPDPLLVLGAPLVLASVDMSLSPLELLKERTDANIRQRTSRSLN